MIYGYFTLLVALTISAIAEYYSIVGLTAIFSAAFWPIVVMGAALGVGKLTAAVWLKLNWNRASWVYKCYLVPSVAVLMLLTSIGCFGYLSKAHSDQSLVSGDSQARVAMYDEKIKTSRENIEANRRALKQMDESVDQVMGRSSDEKGADKAVQLRRAQQKERTRLQSEIENEQKKIASLNEEAAPLRAEFRKVESEVGPIKYIAALIYGDNPDDSILEKAVRLVIIIIVAVFDPLALVLLLAAQQSIRWAHEDKKRKLLEPIVTASAPDQKSAEPPPMPVTPVTVDTQIPPDDLVDYYDPEPVVRVVDHDKKKTILSELDHMWKVKKTTGPDEESLHAPLSDTADWPQYEPDDGALTPEQLEQVHLSAAQSEPDTVSNHNHEDNTDHEEDDDEGISAAEKEAKRLWKLANPGETIKKFRLMHQAGQIDQLPWNTPDYQLSVSDPPSGDGNLWVQQDGKWINAGPVEQFDFAGLGLEADNDPGAPAGQVRGFGTDFPTDPAKGDMFLRVDQLPSVLYKYNGTRWIEVDKSMSDQHAYDTAYIDHLISKIGTGEYDPELLSDAERDSIEQRLNNTPQA
jgi:hypothetical protein